MVAVWAAVLVCAGAGHAYADSLNLTVTQSTDAGVVVTATGSTSDPMGAVLGVQYFSSGAGGCPTDPGAGTQIAPNGTVVNPGGQFNVSSSMPVSVPLGSYVLCGWLTGNSSPMMTTATAPATNFTVTPADTMSLGLPSNPIEGEQLNLTASGTAYDANAAVYATYKPAGGSCASTPQADAGTLSDSDDPVSGQYSTNAVFSQTFDSGSYLVCAWLVDSNTNQLLAQASTTLTVGPLDATLRLAAPSEVDLDEQFPLNISATLNAGITVLATADIVPDRTGTSCAPNPDGEPTSATPALNGEQLNDTQVPAGTVSTSDGTGQISAYGRYLVCAWLLDGWSQSNTPATVAGPISTTVTVVRPLIYRGRTSQRGKLTITVARAERDLYEISYSDHLRCAKPAVMAGGQRWNGDNTDSLTTSNFGVQHIGSSNTLKLRLNGNRNHTFDMTAHVSATAITGVFTEAGTPFGLLGNKAERFRCTTGNVHFTIRT